jgi:hypothetical protein
MRIIQWCTLLLVGCSAVLGPHVSFADYIGPAIPDPFHGGQIRANDSGTKVLDYSLGIPSSIRGQIETAGVNHAVTSDLSTVYQFDNTLGFSAYVLASNVATGQYLPDKSFIAGGVCCAPPPNNYIYHATQPVIHGNDLYVISGEELSNGDISESTLIKHYNLLTKTFIEDIASGPTAHQTIDDLAWRPSGDDSSLANLFVSSQSGISDVFSIGTITGFVPVVPGVRGDIAIGPDDRLFVRNAANGDVERYNLTTGLLIDTFISHTTYPIMGRIQFGVDGDLRIGSTGGNLMTFSGTTGTLLRSTHLPFTSYYGRITYIPVPEPNSAAIIGILTCFVVTFVRQPRQ